MLQWHHLAVDQCQCEQLVTLSHPVIWLAFLPLTLFLFPVTSAERSFLFATLSFRKLGLCESPTMCPKLQPWNGAWVCVCRGVCVWVRFWLDFQEIDACYQWCVFFVSCLASVWFCFNLSSYPVDAKLDFSKVWFLLYFINLITYFYSINVDSQF